ncbi:TIGR00180 family glycosyltransferase [Sulfuricaulis sp.]|uniref:TIGR00180 family glycosyltransferase n=1 Tax=Sulfuricaulis sp. TaxID=2003553 RepID=UPI00355A9D07
MSVLNSMAKLPRYALRLYEWVTGRRLYPWTSSPPHRLFALLAHRAYGWPAPHYRALYAAAAGILKYRERIFADRMNFGARLQDTVDANTLRNVVLWQQAVLNTPPFVPKVHANLRIVGDVQQIQLDRLMSLLLMSDIFANVNLFFDEETVTDARTTSLTIAEERRGWRGSEYDLSAAQPLRAEIFGSAGWAQIFSTRTGFARNINNYVKTAHPGAFVIALSLPEDDDGFCDASAGPWVEAAYTIACDFPDVTFVVLNRVGPAALSSATVPAQTAVTYARKAGLTLAETTILAQKADAFVGQMDMFGLAARAARRPGVYMSPVDEDFSDLAANIIHTGMLRPDEALARLRTVLADRPTHARPAAASLSASSTGIHRRQLRRNLGAPPIPDTVATLCLPEETPTQELIAASSTFLNTVTDKLSSLRAADAPRSSDPLAALYTLVVPTYNRHDMLSQLLAYLGRQRTSFSILVLDSSEAEIQQENVRAISGGPANVRHIAFPPTIDPYVKMREGLSMVTTPFCSLCADDDLIIVPVVQRCVEELDRDPTAAVAHGYYFNFDNTSTFDLSYIVYRGKSLDGKTPMARVRTLFAGYEAVLYGIYRTPIAQRVFRDVDRMNTVLGRELLTAALTVIAGKTLRIPDFYYGRNTGESFSYTAWHPHQILAQTPATLFTQYPVFRELLQEALTEQPSAPDSQTAGMVIDLVMLRYLDPFLRSDVLDLIIDDRLRGKGSDAIVNHLWDVFVRPPRSANPAEPLIDAAGRFTPERIGPGKLRDYHFDSTAMDGKKRQYRVFYEFFYPQMRSAATVSREQMTLLLGSLDAYYKDKRIRAYSPNSVIPDPVYRTEKSN